MVEKFEKKNEWKVCNWMFDVLDEIKVWSEKFEKFGLIWLELAWLETLIILFGVVDESPMLYEYTPHSTTFI